MRDFRDYKTESKCSRCDISSEDYFCNLPEESRKMFESLKMTHYYPKGAKIFVEGQPLNGIYILCSGRVKLTICSKEGRIIILHIAKPGEVLALSEAVSNSLHTATAEVLEQCSVNYVRRKDFLRFLENDPQACLKVINQLSQNYQTACVQIGALGLSATVADKLATLFLGWCESSDEDDDSIHFKVYYTHEELAQMIGTSRETVTRLLKSFRDRNLIKRKGSKFIIPDRKKLEAAIGTRQKY